MNNPHVLILCLITAILSCSSSAAPDCNNATGQAEELFCAQSQYRMDDAELNSVYASIKAKLGKDQAALLVASQKSWISMRDSFCDLVSYENKGSTSYESERTYCLASLTAERIKQLKTLAEQ